MFKVLYECELVEGSVLKSQMKAEGLNELDFTYGDCTEDEYNLKMIKEGFAIIKDNKVTIYADESK